MWHARGPRLAACCGTGTRGASLTASSYHRRLGPASQRDPTSQPSPDPLSPRSRIHSPTRGQIEDRRNQHRTRGNRSGRSSSLTQQCGNHDPRCTSGRTGSQVSNRTTRPTRSRTNCKVRHPIHSRIGYHTRSRQNRTIEGAGIASWPRWPLLSARWLASRRSSTAFSSPRPGLRACPSSPGSGRGCSCSSFR